MKIKRFKGQWTSQVEKLYFQDSFLIVKLLTEFKVTILCCEVETPKSNVLLKHSRGQFRPFYCRPKKFYLCALRKCAAMLSASSTSRLVVYLIMTMISVLFILRLMLWNLTIDIQNSDVFWRINFWSNHVATSIFNILSYEQNITMWPIADSCHIEAIFRIAVWNSSNINSCQFNSEMKIWLPMTSNLYYLMRTRLSHNNGKLKCATHSFFILNIYLSNS